MIDPITSEEMKSGFQQMLGRTLRFRRKTARKIIFATCEANELSVTELMGKERTRRVAWARQDCWREIYANTRMSLPEIGRMFDRDHTTVLFGIRRSEQRRREVEGQA